jgi:clan AA aspartic protease (TIGR02281 family)
MNLIKMVTWFLKAVAIGSFTVALVLIVVAYRPEPLQAEAQGWLKQSSLGFMSQQVGQDKAVVRTPHHTAMPVAESPNWVFASIERLKEWVESLPAAPETITTPSTVGVSVPATPSITNAVVPMELQPKALFVTAHINNHKDGHFILDTGATYMSISNEMAEELGLDLTRTEMIPITTANGRIEVPKVVLKSVKVNGLEAKNVEATVMNFKKDASFSGLLGLSFINQFKLTIDPNKGHLLFEPLQTTQRQAKSN